MSILSDIRAWRKLGLENYYTRISRVEDILSLLDDRIYTVGGSLLDEPVEQISVPILKPEPATVQPQEVPSIVEENVETVSDWLNWLETASGNLEKIKRSAVPKVEKLKKQIDEIWKSIRLFKLVESRSALKNLAKQYTIDGSDYRGDANSFFSAVKLTILRFLNENHNIKFRLVLSCELSRTDITTSETEYTTAYFVSDVHIILQGTSQKDINDIYQRCVEKILESLANFQAGASNWIFELIQQLEIHTVKYQPLRGSSYTVRYRLGYQVKRL